MFLQLAFWNHHLVDHILKCFFLRGGAIDQVPKQSQCMARWWFQICLFSPLPGEMIQFEFDEHIFFNWVETNHQLDFQPKKDPAKPAVLLVNYMVESHKRRAHSGISGILTDHEIFQQNAWKFVH